MLSRLSILLDICSTRVFQFHARACNVPLCIPRTRKEEEEEEGWTKLRSSAASPQVACFKKIGCSAGIFPGQRYPPFGLRVVVDVTVTEARVYDRRPHGPVLRFRNRRVHDHRRVAHGNISSSLSSFPFPVASNSQLHKSR